MRENDLESVRRFYETHKNSLFLYAVSLVQDRQRAEDIIGDVFIRLLRLERIPKKLRPYLFRCVKNAVTDGYRKETTRNDAVFELKSIQESELRGLGLDPTERLQLEEALSQLSENERETIILKVFAGLTFKEISSVKNAPKDTVASWYRRGLQKVEAALSRRK